MSEIDTPKPKKGRKKLVLMLAVLVIAAGGGGAGFYFMGGMGEAKAGEDPNRPHLVVREGVGAAAAAEAEARAERGRPDPRVFQATYHALEGNFTSNLGGGDAFVQLGLGVSTYYGEPVIANLETHQMAIRSAVLMTISQQDPVEILTLEGKTALKAQLRDAINEALTSREGFGGIDEVHFTSFVTQ